jgi:hypothetical protein
MEIKEGNKGSFGLGILIFVVIGINIFFHGFEFETSFYLMYGTYLVWQNGFVRDTSKWKYKPMKIIVVCSAVILCLFSILFIRRTQKSDDFKLAKIEVLRNLANASNDSLPKDVGNGDSLMKVIAIDESNLRYEYKIQYSRDSIILSELEADYKVALISKLKSFDSNTLDVLRKSEINFSHEFKDRNGDFAFKILIKSGEY